MKNTFKAYLIAIGTILFTSVYAEQKTIDNPVPDAEQIEKANDAQAQIQKQISAIYQDDLRKAVDEYWTSRFIQSPPFILTVALLIFAFAIFVLYYFLFIRKEISSYQITRMSLITLIIVATLILIITGYDSEQIAPAIGLLGTIAGYLLGKSQAEEQMDTRNANATANQNENQ